MFESQLQVVQVAYGGSIICSVVAVLTLMFGPLAVGVFFIVLASATGAFGGWLLAEIRGYPPAIGLGMGIAFGTMSAIMLLILPDQSAQREAEAIQKRRERKRRSTNYEVLDDDE